MCPGKSKITLFFIWLTALASCASEPSFSIRPECELAFSAITCLDSIEAHPNPAADFTGRYGQGVIGYTIYGEPYGFGELLMIETLNIVNPINKFGKYRIDYNIHNEQYELLKRK